MGNGVAQPLAVRAVLFDLDGTLADTAGDLADAVNRVRGDRGLPPLPVDAVRIHASSGARGMLGAGMGVTPEHPEYPELRDAFLAYYAQGLARTSRLFDGVDALLRALDARAIAWGIVTNKAERFTRPVTAALGLAARTPVIVSGDTTPHAKPHPAPLLHAATALGVAAGECVYVGDDLRDVQAGNAAGMATLVAMYGYVGAATHPAEWPATGWVDTPVDVLAWLPASAAAR